MNENVFSWCKVNKAEEVRKWEKPKGGKLVHAKFIHTCIWWHPGYFPKWPHCLSIFWNLWSNPIFYSMQYLQLKMHLFPPFSPTGLNLEITLQKRIVWNKMPCSGIRNVFLFHNSFYILREKERIFLSENPAASLVFQITCFGPNGQFNCSSNTRSHTYLLGLGYIIPMIVIFIVGLNPPLISPTYFSTWMRF